MVQGKAAHLGGTTSAMKPNAMYPMGSDAAPTSSRFMVFCARQQPMSRVTWYGQMCGEVLYVHLRACNRQACCKHASATGK